MGSSLSARPPRGRKILSALALALALLPAGVAAQAQSLAELATYAGPDRTQKLIDGAKKENALTIYSSMTTADMGALIAAFAAKYGIKAQHWRGSSEDIRNRTTREYAAGRYEADVAETAGTDMEAMVREQLLQKFVTPVSKELIPQATLPHGQWIATRLSVFAGAYNTNIFKPADAPKTYEDLLNPRFKGKLGIEAEDANWFMSVVGPMGEAKGLKLFQDIVAPTACRSARAIHCSPTSFQLARCRWRSPPTATASSSSRRKARRSRSSICRRWSRFPTGAGVLQARAASHAALLFEDFILTEGQKILRRARMQCQPIQKPDRCRRI